MKENPESRSSTTGIVRVSSIHTYQTHGYRWLWGRLQGIAHGLGIAGNHREISAGRCILFFAALLPIAQRTERNVKTRRKVFLTKFAIPCYRITEQRANG
jgi:hypothetical protein